MHAVIIGATGALGAAVVKLFAREGARLVLAARSSESAKPARGADGREVHLEADVTDAASVEALATAAVAHLRRIDAVVNLAAISPRKGLLDYTPSDVDALLAINVKGPILLTQAFARRMLSQKRGGVILHAGGLADGRLALPFHSAYAATRGALASYLESANKELEGTNVVLSYFGPAPSYTESERAFHDLWMKLGVPIDSPEDTAKEILTSIRIRRPKHVMGGFRMRALAEKSSRAALKPTRRPRAAGAR